MTHRQKLATKEMVENGGTMASALKKAGYSPSIVKNPQKVFSSKGIQAMLGPVMEQERITLASALIPLSKALNAKIIIEKDGMLYETDFDDLNIQLKASDRALRLMGVPKDGFKLSNEQVVFMNNMPRPSL